MNSFDYFAPDSLPEVFDLLGKYGDDAKLIAGGTALVILMRQNLVRPSAVVSLRRLRELGGISSQNGGLKIGALVTHREAEVSPVVVERARVLSETLRHVATIRIRNVGTLGGNLAHADPNQDPPATLIALGASVELSSQQGQRSVPVDEFFTDYYETALQPGEVVTAIHVPSMAPRSVAAFSKFLPRTADDYATVSAACVVTPDESGERCQEVRIGLGSAGSTPIRARQAEDALRGQPLTDENLRAAAAVAKTEVDPISDIRGSAEYKRDMAEVWVRRTLERALGRRP
jgi:aerobic carbon-monoxide dehydrogenase medium subunit